MALFLINVQRILQLLVATSTFDNMILICCFRVVADQSSFITYLVFKETFAALAR